jgi:outer membrane receptor protein involved in Fe transport
MKKCLYTIFVFIIFMGIPQFVLASTGTISGTIVEYLSGKSIPGVYIQVLGTNTEAISNERGEFEISDIPVGNYNIQFSAPEFKPYIKTDVIVRPNRITKIKAGLRVEPIQDKVTMTISANYFQKNEKEPHSVVNLSTEEVRRAPGTAGDVGRMLSSLPSTATISDEYNDLVVRGGNPLENGFFVDNIEIPNLSHFPTMGSTGGTLSAINPDLIAGVDFYTGGFSSIYGDRLSSITEITFREGNREEFDGQIDFSIAQAGGVFEGPIAKGKGSWIISLRKSYANVIQDLGLVDWGATPVFDDVQGKLTIDLSANHKISILNMLAAGYYDYDDGYEIENADYMQNTTGINWFARWSDNFYSNTSFSYAYLKREDNEGFRYSSSLWQWKNDYSESSYSMRNVNSLTMNQKNKLEFGVQVKHRQNDINYSVDRYTDHQGNVVPAIDTHFDYKTTDTGLFLTYIWNPFNNLSLTLGARGDYTTTNEVFHLSPRFSFSLKLVKNLSLNGGFGNYYQSIPLNFLAYNADFSDLEDMKSTHYILGLDYILKGGTKITLEFYDKEYENLPINPKYPNFLVTDRLAFDKYYLPEELVAEGTGRSRGVELMLQKKLVKKFYGILSASYFSSQYKDLSGSEWDRIYDNQYIFSLTGGFKPNKKWEMSLKWTILGGTPYTPIDVEQSKVRNKWILDESKFLGERYPTYNSLNLRVDRRFYFRNSYMIIYLDIWNLLNHKNVAYYSWDYDSNRVQTQYQMSILPVLGIEFEF